MKFFIAALSLFMVFISWWAYIKLLDEARHNADYATLVYLVVCGLLPATYTFFVVYFLVHL